MGKTTTPRFSLFFVRQDGEVNRDWAWRCEACDEAGWARDFVQLGRALTKHVGNHLIAESRLAGVG